MFALYDKSARCFYRGNVETPGPGQRRALRFSSSAEACTERRIVSMTGSWPLFQWSVVNLASA